MTPFCPHCGAEAPEEARFCMRCGRERPGPAGGSGAAPVPPVPTGPPGAPPPPEFPPPAADRPPAFPPQSAHQPPPPGYAPQPVGPAQPSPVGAFFGRAFRGDWAGAAQAALWPVGLLLVGAVALAIPGYGQDAGSGDFVGFGDRLRVALTALMHGLGGSFEVTSAGSGSAVFGDSSGGTQSGSVELSMPPLMVAVLWCVALLIGVRMLRTRMLNSPQVQGQWGPPPARTLGLEAAVRVGLLAMAGTVVLALFGQPTIQQVEFHSNPFLVALCTLALGMAVTVAVFQRSDIAQWLAVRPGVAAASRAFGSAVRALAWVLPLILVAAFVVGIITDDGSGNSDVEDATGGDLAAGIVLLLLYLPNLALTGLGFVWGAPVDVDARGSGFSGSGYTHDSYGLEQLGDDVNSGAVIGVLAFGLVLALLVGVLIARRSRDRRELFLGGGFFYALVLVLGALSGFSMTGSGGLADDVSFAGTSEGGLSMPDLLLFGLLWVGGGVFLAPYLLRLAGFDNGLLKGAAYPAAAGAPDFGTGPQALPPAGSPTAPPSPDIPNLPTETGGSRAPVPGPAPTPGPAPAAAPAPVPAPAPAPVPDPGADAYDPHTVHLAPPPPATAQGPKRRVGVWVATLLGAFVIGGGAAAGVLLLQDDGNGGQDDAKDNKPAAARTEATPQPSDDASGDVSEDGADGASASASPDAAGPSETPEVPEGYHQVVDAKGFSFVVPDVWDREGVDASGTQVTYAGSTGMEEYLIGVIPNADYTSYDNLLNLEAHAKKDKKKANYQRVRLEKNTFQGRPGALWEYTYEDGAGQTVHGIDQSYIAADGTEYAILLTGKDDVWSDLQETYRIGLDSWRLTDTE
ncbi:zinc-ribbon domain-containing protein [Streptomyces sp. VRA16 Mangrove soil]|uniref:zinc-ribbon domain-containing protein n=1 Tax=Streptomyces sp. VRA16 Mangrove soil TaxID=2817434 RepID=UPI00227730DE|nr:zinc-ribbon domain-containing protein [Streptomyces sp. VRA16 Mangrove soil]